MSECGSSKKPEATSIRPTLDTIAKRAGLSTAAVSMALRNSLGVSRDTQRRVQEIAREMGYHPDPKLATLMQHLRQQKDVEYRETIAFLSSYACYADWKGFSQHDFYLGASERALELGYRLEVFHLGVKGMSPARMSNMLETRGIRGILIGGFRDVGATLPLDWKKFAAVSFGFSLTHPVVHRVTTDYYREMLQVLERLECEGFRRVGLNISVNADVKVLNLWRSAYLLFEENLSEGMLAIPANISSLGRDNLKEWAQKYQPDVIVSAGCDFPTDYEKVYGEAAPSDIHYVNMNLHHADDRSRGIDQDSWSIGRLGCEHLVTLLEHNEVGLPEQPQIISIVGQWVDDYNAWLKQLGKRTRPEPLASAKKMQVNAF